MRLGLAGAHNTGKTTLAEALAAAHQGWTLVRVQTSEVFRAHNLHPKNIADFETRLVIQNLILDSAVEQWREAGANFVSDRTPLDMAAYLLADLNGQTPHSPEAVQTYMRRCMTALEGYFDLVVVIPPGVPLLDRVGKAAPMPAYIEHLHALMSGLALDGYANRASFQMGVLPRTCLELNDRLQAVDAKVGELMRFH